MKQLQKQALAFLVVMGFAAGLTLFFVSFNPGKKAVQTLNKERRSDITKIAIALSKYKKANNSLPKSIAELGKGSVYKINCTETFDICDELVPTYLTVMPVDPIFEDVRNSGYAIRIGEKNTVIAPYADLLSEDGKDEEFGASF